MDVKITRDEHINLLAIPEEANISKKMQTRWVSKSMYDTRRSEGYVKIEGRDGPIEKGDMILMGIPKEEYKKRIKLKEDRYKQMISPTPMTIGNINVNIQKRR